MIKSCLVYLYVIGYTPPPLGIRVVVFDQRSCSQEEKEMATDVCGKNGYNNVGYVYHNPYKDHYHVYCKKEK